MRRRLERQQARRRSRPGLLAVLALVLVVAAVAIVASRSHSNGSRATRTRSASGATDRSTSPKHVAAAPTQAASPTTAASSASGGSTTEVAGSQSNSAVALVPADLNRPPDPPVGYYRHGKLYLDGSVPTDAVGAGYLRKARSVLGPSNVIMDMKRDARAPVGPARIIVEEEFQFPTGSSAMDPKFGWLLAVGAEALKRLPETTLVITGYTDNVGSEQVNQSLSEQRAQLVVNYMVAHGIPANRITGIGRGPADPIADNSTRAGRQKNRRIEGVLEGLMPS